MFKISFVSGLALFLAGCDGLVSVDIYTDNETGCQYIYLYNGGITPRLDRNGKHICEDI